MTEDALLWSRNPLCQLCRDPGLWTKAHTLGRVITPSERLTHTHGVGILNLFLNSEKKLQDPEKNNTCKLNPDGV